MKHIKTVNKANLKATAAKGGCGKIECYVGVEQRKDALRGADFVVNAIQVGLYDPCRSCCIYWNSSVFHRYGSFWLD